MLIEKGCRGRSISGDPEVGKEQSFPIVWTKMVGKISVCSFSGC